MKALLISILVILAQSNILSQHIVTGQISDENGTPLIGATVVLLEPQDSAMVSFAISDNDGRFTLDEVESGPNILQLSFVSYKTDYHNIEIKEGERKVDIGKYQLEPYSEILQEVTVKAEHIPMGIIGDTISYNAAAFQVRPGASVEDLLKKLPGVEVRRDGSIKAMGEDVQNVLVDGKEFFGDDPKIATKNLQAEAVDKVQVFDKKSEIAEFTGIDDGEEEKTINLKLKEGYKTGGFGNVEGLGGTESRYAGKVNYNRFSPKMQASIISGANNINRQAFSFNEYIQFMGGLGNAISSMDGAFNFGEFGGGRAPQGLTDNISTGINFNYDFSKKLQLTSHYFYTRADQNLSTNTINNQFTESQDFITKDESIANNINQNQRLSARLEYKITQLAHLVIKNSLYDIDGSNQINSATLFEQDMISFSNTSATRLSNTDQFGYEGKIQYRKKYKKKGRSWINTLDLRLGSHNQSNDVLNEFFLNEELSLLNQTQNYIFNKESTSLSTVYSEPLGKKTYLGLKYFLNYDLENPRKSFYDIVNEEQILNSQLTGSYEKNTTTHRPELSLRKNTKKYKLNSALGMQWSSIQGSSDQSGGRAASFSNNSLYLLPSLSIERKLSKSDELEFSYNTSVRLPTLNQLAPLPDNSDPNILILGNPSLSPEYYHDIRLGYQSIDPFNFKNLFIRTNLMVIQNRIINEVSINEQLIKTLTPINAQQFVQGSGYFSYSAPIRVLKIKFRTSTNISFASYLSNLNGTPSDVKQSNINYNLVLENRNKDHVDVATGIRLDYNTRQYEINSNFDQQFFNYRLFVDGIFYIGKEWTISSKYDHIVYSGEFFSEARSFNIWNASIRKSFNEDKIAIEVGVNDILNQNRGVERSGGLNTLYERRYNTLARYFMLGLKVKIGRKQKKDGISFG